MGDQQETAGTEYETLSDTGCSSKTRYIELLRDPQEDVYDFSIVCDNGIVSASRLVISLFSALIRQAQIEIVSPLIFQRS